MHRRSGPCVISPGRLSLKPVDRGSQTPGPRLAEVVRVLLEHLQRTVGRMPRVLHGLAARLAV